MQNTIYRVVRFVWFAALAGTIPVLSQAQEGKQPSFEVVSIKPNTDPPGASRGGGARGNRVAFTGATLRNLLQIAYRGATAGALSTSQIIGAPSWIDSDRFDLQAKAEGDAPSIPQTELPLLMRSLLEDRFKLKAHVEKRELPIYNLVVVKEGKIRLSRDQKPGDINQTGSPTAITFSAPSMSIAPNFVSFLQQQVGRTVFDKTNLQGLYDLTLTFSPDGVSSPPTADSPNATLFTAIQEQLGLKLESSKGPVDVLVIESVQKPTQN